MFYRSPAQFRRAERGNCATLPLFSGNGHIFYHHARTAKAGEAGGLGEPQIVTDQADLAQQVKEVAGNGNIMHCAAALAIRDAITACQQREVTGDGVGTGVQTVK